MPTGDGGGYGRLPRGVGAPQECLLAADEGEEVLGQILDGRPVPLSPGITVCEEGEQGGRGGLKTRRK